MRECIVEHRAAINCTGDRVQIQDCNTHHCPSTQQTPVLNVQFHTLFFTVVDGEWSVWSEWSECSTTCGEGEQIRRRSCTNPSPQYGGKDCEGEALERKTCHLRHCPGEGSNLQDSIEQNRMVHQTCGQTLPCALQNVVMLSFIFGLLDNALQAHLLAICRLQSTFNYAL